MKYKRGDLVTRKSYNHDTVFKILNIKDNICYLKGLDVRLYADSMLEDLSIYQKEKDKQDEFKPDLDNLRPLERNDYFYMPAKILHFDGDNDYLKRCLDFYKKYNLRAVGKIIRENEIPNKIMGFLNEYNPDIIIITGHDAYYRKKGDINDINSYKNSKYFSEAIRVARRFEKNHDKLVIIAGACQSDYEELIKSGANYASSPKRVNIHALDPAIIAVTVALTENTQVINLIDTLSKTKYGSDGIGGIKGVGLMFVGYPR